MTICLLFSHRWPGPHISVVPQKNLSIALHAPGATTTTSEILPEIIPGVGGGGDRYGKHLGHIYITPKPEPITCHLPIKKLRVKLKVLKAVISEHSRVTLPVVLIGLEPHAPQAVSGFDEARLQEDLEIIQLALDDEPTRERGYTPANVIGYYEQQQFNADLEAIFLALDQR